MVLWTKEEIDILKNNQDKSINEIKKLLVNRDNVQIRGKMDKLGLNYKKKDYGTKIWSQEELLFVYENRFKMLSYEISKLIGISTRKIKRMIYNINHLSKEEFNIFINKYPKHRNFDNVKFQLNEDDILFVKNNHINSSISEMAVKLDVSNYLIEQTLDDLGLFRKRNRKGDNKKEYNEFRERIKEEREKIMNEFEKNNENNKENISSLKACVINQCKPFQYLINDISDILVGEFDKEFIKKIYIDLQKRTYRLGRSLNPKSLVYTAFFLAGDMLITSFDNKNMDITSVTIRNTLFHLLLNSKKQNEFNSNKIRNWYIINKIYEK